MRKAVFGLLLPWCCLAVLLSCQTRREGAVEGKVVPPCPGVRIIVSQTGRDRGTVDADARDGRFRVVLAPGKYDVRIRSVALPFPITVAGVNVDPGKTSTLPPFQMTRISGTAAISGTVMPGGPGTRVTLLYEGREQASVAAAPDGRYEFTALPAGDYTLTASSPGYASDTVKIRASSELRVSQNIRLFFISPLDGVDWDKGVIHARGKGVYPPDSTNRTAMHEMARRAALSDAERNLLRIIEQIKLDSNHSLKTAMTSGTFTTKIEGYLKQFRIVEEHDVIGGLEVEIELPLTGSNGLSRFISD